MSWEDGGQWTDLQRAVLEKLDDGWWHTAREVAGRLRKDQRSVSVSLRSLIKAGAVVEIRSKTLGEPKYRRTDLTAT